MAAARYHPVSMALHWLVALLVLAQIARGDENNQDANGPLPAFSIAFATARYTAAPGWELALKIDNLFNRRYENFGVLGQNFFAGPGRSFDPAAAVAEQFRSPAAPRAIWVSLRYEIREGDKR